MNKLSYIQSFNFYGKFDPCFCKELYCTCEKIHSYIQYYKEILNIINPKSIYEWGPGINTKMALEHGAKVHTKEFNEKWKFIGGKKYGSKFIQKIIDSKNPEWTKIDTPKLWDLFFIDSRERQICIKNAFNEGREDSITIVHDAQRNRYHKYIGKFPFVYFPSRGLAIATKSEKLFKIISDIKN